ncbi:MAG TPA: glycerol-3-phosphate dehydrogenase/oxidase [Ktedonobacteraceae bacterium]|nr:glycerol-3-phosphate dehydrogenase/oxidase [Ktedonobacteraceae bacterium]
MLLQPRMSLTMMLPLSATVRTDNLSRMERELFDVLVIGGGVTGAGVALDAAARGYRVALVEKGDFASSTSGKSTKLVHGGIRYLPNFDFALVREALVERGILLKNAPFLVHPIGFLLPIYKGDRHPVGIPFTTPGGLGLSLILNFGLWFYDMLAGRAGVGRHRHLSRSEMLKLAPMLVSEGLKEGFIYYDAQTHDARLTMALIRTAVEHGAVVATYAEVTAFSSEDGTVKGVSVHDWSGGRDLTIRARHIVNATGIFSEKVEELTRLDLPVQIEPSKGVHLVLERAGIQPGKDAIVLPETDDKRILFIVPWESRVIFGTTDTGKGNLDSPSATAKDVAYLLKYLNRYLAVHLTEAEVISTYAGYRPLVSSRRSRRSTARLSRTHAVLQGSSGLVTIVGGKLTTYRRMAQDTVDVLSRRDGVRAPSHPTRHLPLSGSVGWSDTQNNLFARGTTLGLDHQVIEHLGRSYGTHSAEVLSLVEQDATLGRRLIDDLPYIRAEVVYGCRQEMAMTPLDVLARRTSITIEDSHHGLNVLADVAALMAPELGWSSEQKEIMSEAFRSEIRQQYMAWIRPPQATKAITRDSEQGENRL